MKEDYNEYLILCCFWQLLLTRVRPGLVWTDGHCQVKFIKYRSTIFHKNYILIKIKLEEFIWFLKLLLFFRTKFKYIINRSTNSRSILRLSLTHMFLKYFLHYFLCMDNLNISYFSPKILMKMAISRFSKILKIIYFVVVFFFYIKYPYR